MGLFSSKKSVTNVTELTQVENISLSDIEDSVALAGVRDSDISINIGDQGAFDLAEGVIVEGFDVIGDAFSENIALTGEVLEFADASSERTAIALREGQEDAFQFGTEAFGFVEAANQASLEFVDDLQNRSLDTVGELADRFSEFASGQSTELRNVIGDIQQRESRNTDARLGDIAKVSLIVVGVVGTGAIAIAFFKGK